MRCSITQLLEKSVINCVSGDKIGYLCDVELDTQNACLSALIVAVKTKNASIFGKCEKIRIDWSDIQVIGKDAVLVDCRGELKSVVEERSFFDKLWN